MKNSLLILNKPFFFFFYIFLTSFFITAQCPSGAILLTSTTSTINNGETYCASSDVVISGVMTVNPGGKLYIDSGVKVTSSGNFKISGGEVHVLPESALYAEGGITIGSFGSQNNSLLKVYTKAYFTAKGAVT